MPAGRPDESARRAPVLGSRLYLVPGLAQGTDRLLVVGNDHRGVALRGHDRCVAPEHVDLGVSALEPGRSLAQRFRRVDRVEAEEAPELDGRVAVLARALECHVLEHGGHRIVGRVHLAEIWRYPVKSLGGERLHEAELTPRGIPGDRGVHLVDRDGNVLTGRRSRRLVTVPAALGEDGEALVDGEPWTSGAAATLVERAGGNGARLVRSDHGHLHDDTPLLVGTDGAYDWLDEDRRRFRANLVVGGVDGLAERGWPGRQLRVGDAVVAVSHLCKRCVMTTVDPDTADTDPSILERVGSRLDGRFALNCDVNLPGRVVVGDEVELL